MRLLVVVSSMVLAACSSQPAADTKDKPLEPLPILGFIRDRCHMVLDEIGVQVELMKADLLRCDGKLAFRRSRKIRHAMIPPCRRLVHFDAPMERQLCKKAWRSPGDGLVAPVSLIASWPLEEASQRDALDRAGQGQQGDVTGSQACDLPPDVLEQHLRDFQQRCRCEKNDDGFSCEVRR